MARRIDLTNQIIGRLTVIREVEPKGYHRRYLCECTCGTKKVIRMDHLRTGKIQSCGCYNKERVSETASLDLTGRKFDKLKVIKRSDKEYKDRFTWWVCECDCGNIKAIRGISLTSGASTSCGCNHVEVGYKLQQYVEGNYRKDGVLTSNLTQKLSKRNKTGVKGVSYAEDRNKYRAYITIKRKQIKLGDFDTLVEAAEARKKAEEIYHKPYLEMKNETE